jgi:hypothetical protein
MSFLKRFANFLFRDGASKPSDGIFAYVRIKRTGEVVRVRMMRGYDISQDDNGGFFSRKLVMGTRGFEQIDCTFYFDSSYHLVNTEVGRGGELATEEDYQKQSSGS